MHKLYCKCICVSLKHAIIDKLHGSIFGATPGDRCVFIQTQCVNIMRQCHKYRVPLAMATLDISRAFATVPHCTVVQSLVDLDAPPALIALVSAEIGGNSLNIRVMGGARLKIAMERGIVEGSPFSMVLILCVQSMLIRRLLSDPTFCEALARLPPAPNCMEVCIEPMVWVDDLTLTASSSDGLQRQVTIVNAALRQINMNFKVKKFHWMTTDSMKTLEIWHEGTAIRKQESLNVLGLEVCHNGSPHFAISARRAAATAKWFSLARDANFHKLALHTIYRLHNTMYLPSMAYGISAYPMSTSLLQDISKGSSSHILQYHRRPQHMDVGSWIRTVRGRLRTKRLDGSLRTRIQHIVNDLRALHDFARRDRGRQLERILNWRNAAWRATVDRNVRPQQRRSGDHAELCLLGTDLEFLGFLRLHVA